MTKHPGLELMELEMGAQPRDALETFRQAAPAAAQIAKRISATGKVVLYGIGGSHYVNRIVEILYLRAGVDARAIVASDALLTPLPPSARVALITSQSGRSGEIAALIARATGDEERYAITLEPDSPLCRQSVGALVAVGGSERAFAATRSIVLSIAMHAAILDALGLSQQDMLKALVAEDQLDAAVTGESLLNSEVILFVGRHVMRGVAESAALSLMELARVPTIALEGGQFRHGPFEFLRPGLAVVLFRSSGPDKNGIAELAQVANQAGCNTLILDSSGLPPVAPHSICLPAAGELAAAVQALRFLQRVNLYVAARRIPEGAGAPLRTNKVTI